MAIDNILNPMVRGTQPTPNPQEKPNMLVDIVAAPIRGVEGAFQGLYDLADFATGDNLLPDYDKRLFGRSQTFAGTMVEGVTQFLTGFVPVAGQLSKVSKLSKVGKAGRRKLNTAGYAVGGAVADATVFQAQEERLSNLIQAFPELQNPVTEYLAADDDDGELEGRLKNTLEGLALGGLVDTFVAGIRAVRKGKRGDDPNKVMSEYEGVAYNFRADDNALRADKAEGANFRNDLETQFGANQPTNAYDALVGLMKNYDGEYKSLFEALAQNAETSLKRAKFKLGETKGYLGTYNANRHEITMSGGGYRTFAHELMHATTSQALRDNFYRSSGVDDVNVRVQQLDRETVETLASDEANPLSLLASAYLKTVDALKMSEEVFPTKGDKLDRPAELRVYGLSNLDEFITEAFTNPEFRRVLSEIPSASAKERTMFDDFMDAIKSLLGIEGGNARLIDDVMKGTDTLIRDQEARFDTDFARLKEIDELSLGQRNYRTLDDRGEDFEGFDKKDRISETQSDNLISTRGTTEEDYIFPVGKKFNGFPIEEVPTGYLKNVMTWTSVRNDVKARIERELNARESGTASGPERDMTPAEYIEAKRDAEANLANKGSADRRKFKAARAIMERGPNTVDGDLGFGYADVDEYRAHLAGKISDGEMAYRRYRRSRSKPGGKAESRSQTLKQYLETRDIEEFKRYGNATNTKNPRIQGKSQRSSNFEWSKRLKLPSDSITDARYRGRMAERPLKPTFDKKIIDLKVKMEVDEFDRLNKLTSDERKQMTERLTKKYQKTGLMTDIRPETLGQRELPTEMGQASIKEINRIVKDSYGKVPTDVIEGMKPSSLKDFKDHYFRLLDPDPSVGKELEAVRELKTVTQKVEATLKEVNKEGIIPEYAATQKKALTNALEEFVGAHAALSERGITRIDGLDKVYTNADAVLRDAENLLEQEQTLGQRELGVPSIDELRNNVEASKQWAFTMRAQQMGFGMEPEEAYLMTSSLRFIAGQAIDEDLEVLTQIGDSLAKNTKEAEKDSIDIIKNVYGPYAKDIIDEATRNGYNDNKKLESMLEKADAMVLSNAFTNRIFDQIKGLDKVTREKIADNLEKTNKKVEASDGETVGKTAASAFGVNDGDSYEDLIYLLRGGVEKEEALDDVLGQRALDEVLQDSIDRLAKNLETGGDQAILSAARNIRSTDQAIGLIQAIAKNLTETGKQSKTSVEELVAETEETVGVLGGDPEKYGDMVKKVQAQGLSLQDYRDSQRAIKSLIDKMSSNAIDIANKAQAARDNPKIDKKQAEVELLDALDQLTEVQRIWSLMGREAGLTLVQRKFLGNAGGQYRTKKNIGFNTKTARPTDYDKYINSNTGGMGIDKLVDALAGAGSKAEANARMKKVLAVNKEASGSKLMDITMEYYMNSLLSGPTTQLVNILGNSLTLALRTAELAAGGLLAGDPAVTKAVLKHAFDMDMFKEAWSVAVHSFKKNESTLTQGSRTLDDRVMNERAIGMDGKGALADSVNALGTVVNLPSRALQMGDEFFKQLNYRQYVKMNLAYEGLTKHGIRDGRQLAEYVIKNFDKYVTQGGRAYNEQGIYLDAVAAANKQGLKAGTAQDEFIENYLKENAFDDSRGGLADAALNYAEVGTFTNDLRKDGIIGPISNSLSQLKNKGPYWQTLNFVIPFLRTPTNILSFALDRTPISVVGDAFNLMRRRDDATLALRSDDPFVRAQAHGKLATATSVSAAALWYTMANKEFITGKGPATPEEREVLEKSGWRPYSIKIGDTYISYARLDPAATIIGLFADLVEASEYHDFSDNTFQDMFAAVALSLQNNITHKSYLKGLDSMLNFVKDPVKNAEAFGGNIVGGFAPTLFSQMQNAGDERALRETRSIFDYFLKRTPAVGTLPLKRDFLGDPLVMKTAAFGIKGTGVINPFYFSHDSDDIVDQELAELKHGFSMPDSKLHNAIQTKDIYNDDGRQAYDRWLELTGTTKIGNKTLKQQLRKLVTSKGYQAMPMESRDDLGLKSPRIKAVLKIVGAYRRKAKREMISEFPDVQTALTEMQQGREQYRLIN